MGGSNISESEPGAVHPSQFPSDLPQAAAKKNPTSQVALPAVKGEERVSKSARLGLGLSIRSILSTKTPLLARLGAVISGLWFRASLTDKKAQAAVAQLGENFGNLADTRSFKIAQPGKQGEQIVALIVSPNTRLACKSSKSRGRGSWL